MSDVSVTTYTVCCLIDQIIMQKKMLRVMFYYLILSRFCDLKKGYLITIQTSVSISASSQSVLVRYALDLENRDCPLSFTLESHQVSMTSRPAWRFWTGAVINNSFSAHMERELHTRARLNLPPLDNYMFLKLYFTMWFHRFNSTNWQVKLLSCWIIHRSMSLWILALSSQWSFGRDQHSSQVFNAKVKMTRVIQV